MGAKGDKKLFRSLAKEMLSNEAVDKKLVNEIIKNPGKKIKEIVKNFLDASVKVEEKQEEKVDEMVAFKMASLIDIFPEFDFDMLKGFVTENPNMQLQEVIESLVASGDMMKN